MRSNDHQPAPWDTPIGRPCYANAPGCPPSPDRGAQHWCGGECGHTGALPAKLSSRGLVEPGQQGFRLLVAGDGNLRYAGFDVLWLKGKNLRGWPSGVAFTVSAYPGQPMIGTKQLGWHVFVVVQGWTSVRDPTLLLHPSVAGGLI
jgi:hypothetical protein